MKFTINGADTALSTVATVVDSINNYTETRSLANVTKLTRVEPLVILSKDCSNLDYMPDIMQSLLAIFSGYYLQAISLLTKINNVEVIKTLDSLNPNRDATGLALTERFKPATESYRHVSLESMQFSLPTERTIASEAIDISQDKLQNYLDKFADPDIDKDKIGSKKPNFSDKVNSANFDVIAQASNLSIGKMLNVELVAADKEGRHALTLPINVRLLANVISNVNLLRLLVAKTEDTSLFERFHAWRSGRISFIRDLILAQDLIDEHRKALMSDESGLMSEILRRVYNTKKFGILTQNPSLASASNIFVMTEDVAREVGMKLGGKLDNLRVRSKVFENTYAMILVVIDREFERVIFYTRGLSAEASFSVKEIKQSNKNKGPDIMDIMNSMLRGMPPTF